MLLTHLVPVNRIPGLPCSGQTITQAQVGWYLSDKVIVESQPQPCVEKRPIETSPSYPIGTTTL